MLLHDRSSLLRAVTLTLSLATSLTACGGKSSYDVKGLAPVTKVAVVTISGGLRGHATPIGCAPLVEAYAKALDAKFQTAKDFTHVPWTAVLASKSYQEAKDLGAGLPALAGAVGSKTIRLDDATRKALCHDLAADGLLVAMVEYHVQNDAGEITFSAYPAARLYVSGRQEPVWTSEGETSSSKGIPIPLGMHARLAAKALVFGDASDEDVAEIMKLALDQDGGLASGTAEAVLEELSRVLRVAQGKESYSFNEIATSGTWGRFLEWDAAWRALLFCLGCFALAAAFMAIFRKSAEAGGITALICSLAGLYYAYQLLKALL